MGELTVALDALREELIEHAGGLEILLCAGVEGVCSSKFEWSRLGILEGPSISIRDAYMEFSQISEHRET